MARADVPFLIQNALMFMVAEIAMSNIYSFQKETHYG